MMLDMATGTLPDLPAELGDEIKQIPDIRIDEAAFVEAKVPRGKTADGEPADELNCIAVARLYNDPNQVPSFDLVSGDINRLRDQIASGQVVIGSVLSQKTGLKFGDKLPLETRDGVQNIPICGVANESMVGGLAIHMDREHAKDWLGLDRI